jgi:hypothetical protein
MSTDIQEQVQAAIDGMPEMPPDLPMFRAGPMTLMPTAGLGNRLDVLAADILARARPRLARSRACTRRCSVRSTG